MKTAQDGAMRLDKLLSMAGMSRSDAKKAAAAGRVTVGGRAVRDASVKVRADEVCLDGAPISVEHEVYLMIDKPKGVVTATEDGRFQTVTDLLPEKYVRRKIGPVGRLDRDVTGLVLLTTDGELAHRLISPKWKAEKVYRARCEGCLQQQDVQRFEAGVELSDFTALPAKMRILEASDAGSVADVTLTEGKFHQVKRMFAAIGHPLTSLRRLEIGGVKLDETLGEGGFRPLTDDELGTLLHQTGLKRE